MNRYRYSLFVVTVFLALVISAVWTAPALADDGGPPPPTDVPVVVVDPPVVDAATDPATIPTEVLTVTEEPAPVESTVADLLVSVPEGTDVVVLDANGDTLPLASQGAADALSEGDPMWCPVGVTPGGAGCTISFGSLQQLVTAVGVSFNPAANGVIWIENTTFAPAGDIVFDGSILGTWATWSNFSLTFKGGWSGSGTTITTTPSTIQDSLSIYSWHGDVTLSDILITGVTGGASTALTVTTTKNITTTRVSVDTNAGNGALLDNSAGTGMITVSSSNFSNNTLGNGLVANSKGAITLNSITANNNGLHAVILDNSTASTAQAISLTGTNTISGNYYGLQVDSVGAITINNLTANLNPGGYGAYLRNHTAATPQNVTLTGMNAFDSNFGGLYVESKGVITLNNVTASLNTNNAGAWLNNIAGTANIVVNSSQFNGNVGNVNGNGLYVLSRGSILFNNVTAANNGYAGARLWNNYTGSTGSVTLTGSNNFSSNNYTGLIVYSYGTITLNNITANSSVTGAGVYLSNSGALTPKDVTLTGTNTFNGNYLNGLSVYSVGAIAVNNITANSSINGWGATLTNDTAISAKPVTLTGTNTFNGNFGTGLGVWSKGAITGNNLTANSNVSWMGAYLQNDSALTAQAVTLTGLNTFNLNNWTGLIVYSEGAITLKDVTANNNGDGIYLDNTAGTAVSNIIFQGVTIASGNNGTGINASSDGTITSGTILANSNHGTGAILDNSSAATALAVTITGPSQFKFNWGDGLTVYSNGAISLNSITANSNGGNGAYLDNDAFPGGVANVTVAGANNFNNNFLSGLEVYSDGIVTINNIFANNNGGDNGFDTPYGYGLYVDNHGSSTPKAVSVTVSGVNPDSRFNNNYSGGLVIYSKGAITVSGVNAAGQANGNGVTLKNDYAGAVGGITIAGWGIATGNNSNGYGLNATSFGAITITSLYTWGNSLYGATLDNSGGIAAITISKETGHWGNSGDGLIINSKGAITLANLTASGNGGYGMNADNSFVGSIGGITLNGTSDINNNGKDGLFIKSLGNILLKDLDSRNNGTSGDPLYGNGALLDNTLGTGNITVGTNLANWCNDFSNNFLSGLEIHSKGSVTVSNQCNNNNGGDNTFDPPYGYGLYVDNSTASSPKTVTIKGWNTFNNNWNGGVFILSRGAVTINSINISDSGTGATIDNLASGSASPQNVTLTGNNSFVNNYTDGLVVNTYGAITLNNIEARDNGIRSGTNGYGVYLDNSSGSIAKTVTLNGDNSFNNNYTGGLEVHSKGAITVNNFRADNNTDFGGFLDNSGASTPAAVTINTNAYTSDNGGYGLQVLSKGAITISVSDAWIGNNGSYGWKLDNSGVGAVGGITLTSPNVDWAFDFWNNTYGLWAISRGAIKITGLDSTENDTFGATLDNSLGGPAATVTITAPAGAGNNNFGGNGTDGLTVYSKGAITMGGLNSNDNGSAGVLLDNTNSGSGSPQNVTLTGKNDFHNNGDTGLIVLTFGQITLNNINTTDNGQNNFALAAIPSPTDPTTGWGAYLDNCGYVGTVCTTAVTPKAITLTGHNTFNGNFQDGLWATSLGAIKTYDLQANQNNGNGAYLDNMWAGAVGGITLTNAVAIDLSDFENNSGIGLLAHSNGAMTINNIKAANNTNGGAILDALGPVTLTGRQEFIGNGDWSSHTAFGLQVSSLGAITISNLTASGNDGEGAYLDNCQWTGSACAGTGNITLTGANTFNDNHDNGLTFDSHGAVTISNLTTDSNGGTGISGGATGNITLSCGSMTNNGSYGWSFVSPLNVILKGVFALGNNGGSGDTNLIGGTLIETRTCP